MHRLPREAASLLFIFLGCAALARGGEHSYRNTQLAHLRCNLVKEAG